MATITPFRAFRPVPEHVAQVASLPYDVLSTEEARDSACNNPYSFLHVIKAEIDLDPHTDSHAPEVYALAHDNLQRFINEGILVQDRQDCLYIYRETVGEKSQTGLVVCTPIVDYVDGKIKIHEYTRPDKVHDRMRYIEACGAHTGLIFLTYRQQPLVNQTVASWIANHAPVYDFTTDDGVRHTVWVIDREKTIEDLIRIFEPVEALYVADGHHRAEAAAEFARRQRHANVTGQEPWNAFMAVLFPSDQLTILGYNRVVTDLNNVSEQEFLQKVAEKFEIKPYSGDGPYRPEARHTFGMYLAHAWYILRAKAGTFQEADPAKSLDAAILQQNLLEPVLAIQDPRTDMRVEFIGGIRGLEELERKVDEGRHQVAFSMYPTTIDEVLAVADAGEVMFPKSTWFEPKLRSGLFVHRWE